MINELITLPVEFENEAPNKGVKVPDLNPPNARSDEVPVPKL